MKFFKSILFWGSLIVIAFSLGLFFLFPVLGVAEIAIRILSALLLFILGMAVILIISYRKMALGAKDSQANQNMGFEGDSQLVNNWAIPMRQEIMDALSILSGRHSKSALKKFKFALVIGSDRSGKSTLMSHSGQAISRVFPAPGEASQRSHNFCTWYISGHSVYIEAPYSLYNSMSAPGEGELETYLSILRREGKEKCLDQILIAVNIQELAGSNDSIEHLSVELRERLTIALKSSALDIPVYLNFTHLDALPGFGDFCSNLKGVEQEQILGAALPIYQNPLAPRPAFEREFDRLYQSIQSKTLSRLAEVHSPVEKQRVFLFPNEFGAMREKLGRFVDDVFRKTLQAERPLFRGFFFTSITQANAPSAIAEPQGFDSGFSDTIMSHPLNPHQNLDKPVFKQQASEGRYSAYFSGLLFNGLLKSDSNLSSFPAYRKTKMSRNVLASVTAMIVLGCMFLAYGGLSYLHSSSLSKKTVEAISKSKRIRWQNPDNFKQEFELFEQVAAQINLYENHEEHGSPWSLGPGYDFSSLALEKLRKVYYFHLHNLVVGAMLEQLRGDLYYSSYYSAEDRDRLYSDLALYLSVTDMGIPHRKEIDTYQLSQGLFSNWNKNLSEKVGLMYLPPNFERQLEEQAERYSKDLLAGKLPTDGNKKYQSDKKSVESAREALQGTPSIDGLYNSIVSQAKDYEDLTLESMGLSADGLITSSSKVRGFYTKAAFEQGVLAYIDEAAEKPHKKDWVMGGRISELPPEMADKRKLARALKTRYFEEYRKEWLKFLASLKTEVPTNLTMMSGRIVGFGSETQGLKRVFSRTLEEVNLIPPKNKHVDNEIKRKTKHSLLGKMAKENFDNRDDPRKELLESFNIIALLNGDEGNPGILRHYIDGIKTLGADLNQFSLHDKPGIPILKYLQDVYSNAPANPLVHCWSQSVNIMEQTPDDVKSWLGPLLQSSIREVLSYLVSLAQGNLEEFYNKEVYQPYVERIKGRYPFEKDKSNEANIEDINNYFNKESGRFHVFIKTYLKPFLTEINGLYVAKQWNGIKMSFSVEALQTLNQGIALSDRVFQALSREVKTFPLSLTLYHAQNASKVEFKFQEMELVTNNVTPKLNQTVEWPNDNAHKGASIKVTLPNGKSQTIEAPGPWGIFRVLEKSRRFKPRGTGFDAYWRIRVENKYDIDVKIGCELREVVNPFTQSRFYDFEAAPTLLEDKPNT